MKKSKILLLTVLATSIVACSNSTDPNKVDYTTPGVKIDEYALEIPPDLVSDLEEGSKYTVPEATGTIKASEVAKHPDRASSSFRQVLPEVDGVRIVNEGSTRWLIVDDLSPQDIWPLLKTFWTETGFIIDKEQAKIGFMETQWAENRAKIPNDPVRRLFESVGLGGVYSSGLRDKFTIQVERTTNGSRVTFTHQGMEEVFVGRAKDTIKWVPRDREPLLESKLINMFMLRLGLDETTVEKIESEQSADGSDTETKKKKNEVTNNHSEQLVDGLPQVLSRNSSKVRDHVAAVASPVALTARALTPQPKIAAISKVEQQNSSPEDSSAKAIEQQNSNQAKPLNKELQSRKLIKSATVDEASLPIRIRHEGNSLSEASTSVKSAKVSSPSSDSTLPVDIQTKPRNHQLAYAENNKNISSRTIVTNYTKLDRQHNIIIPGDLKSNKSKIKAALKNIGLKISDSKDNGQTLLVYQNSVDINETMKHKPSFLPSIFSKSKTTDRKVLIIKLSESATSTAILVTDENNSRGRNSKNITTLLFRELR